MQQEAVTIELVSRVAREAARTGHRAVWLCAGHNGHQYGGAL